ncbi:MAG: DNA primase [Flavobacteriales bacterium TMED288]|nr:DNA primase [Flavobacteriales bacterium]RPG53054.1 MAG: DNA primase [Flavobacteriales bacterium TMED288]
MIPKLTIDNIFEASKIEEVVQDFISLKKRGANLIGKCPFHDEKTPSFTVSPSKNIFKCFGCGKGGNPVNFIMEHEKLSYPQALEYLAQKYNIIIEKLELSSDQKKKLEEKEGLYIINNLASKFYKKSLLNSKEGKLLALSYLYSRGFNYEIIDKFDIGFCFNKKENFYNYAENLKYSKKLILNSGLCFKKNNKIIERFVNRIIFPIHSLSGRVLGFGGRILKQDKNLAKYINSSENEIYIKSKILYGIYQSKSEIIKHNNCFIVEGYTDVLSLHQNGIKNTVASSGTALTEGQIKLISRFTNNITLLFDGDEAGIKASLRGVNLILKNGLNLKVVNFPKGEDPDSFAKNHGAFMLQSFLSENEKDFIDFRLNIISDKDKRDPIKRSNLIKELSLSISLISDPITRAVYSQDLSKKLEISESLINSNINSIIKPNNRLKVISSEKILLNKDIYESQLIKYMIKYSNENIIVFSSGKNTEINIIEYIKNSLSEKIEKNESWIKNKLLKKIFNEILLHHSIKKNLLNFFINHSDPNICKKVVELIFEKHTLSNWGKKNIWVPLEVDKLSSLVQESLLRLMQLRLEDLINKTKEKLSSDVENNTYLKKLISLTAAKNKIKIKLGRDC